MDQFPSNSKAAPGEPIEKKIEQVTTTGAKTRKKGLGRKFTETFVGGSPRGAVEYMVLNVLIPSARDMLAEAVSQGFERLIYGEGRSSGGIRRAPSGMAGHIQYNRMSGGQRPLESRSISKRGRANHEFDEVLIGSRQEAELVLERLFDILSQYQEVTVADLYALVGINATHSDQKWGWTDLKGSSTQRVRDGYILVLSSPDPL
jgi:hypothetical protein